MIPGAIAGKTRKKAKMSHYRPILLRTPLRKKAEVLPRKKKSNTSFTIWMDALRNAIAMSLIHFHHEDNYGIKKQTP